MENVTFEKRQSSASNHFLLFIRWGIVLNAEGVGTILRIEYHQKNLFILFITLFYLIKATILTVKAVGAFVVPAVAPAPESILVEQMC